MERAEIIWEKGTNRSAFFRGEVDKYGWVDVGSSFLPSEITAAFLWAQLENLEDIQKKRIEVWNYYYENLKSSLFSLPSIPDYASNNAHMFYIVFDSIKERSNTIQQLNDKGVLAVFHYLSLHKSAYYKNKHDQRKLLQSDYFSNHLLRLPFYFELKEKDLALVCELLNKTELTT